MSWFDPMNLAVLGPMALRLLAAALLSGLIGFEREYAGRPAGLRTHLLVGLGSCLVMLTGAYVFLLYQHQTSLDPMRLGAQVIAGVGFLGAGTIIRHDGGVRGLTTAASLWGVACIGLACGIGFYTGAVAAALLILIALQFLTRLDRRVEARLTTSYKKYCRVTVELVEGFPSARSCLELLTRQGLDVISYELRQEPLSVLMIVRTQWPASADLNGILASIEAEPGLSIQSLKIFAEK